MGVSSLKSSAWPLSSFTNKVGIHHLLSEGSPGQITKRMGSRTQSSVTFWRQAGRPLPIVLLGGHQPFPWEHSFILSQCACYTLPVAPYQFELIAELPCPDF